MSLLAAHGVSFSYGAATVLTDAELSVAAGDAVAVAGPNGAGKSTLLRLLAGLEQPDSGEITAAGTVGLLPQERDRQDGETLLGYVARRTGVAAAEEAMLAAAESMARAGPGDAGSAYASALDRYLALGGPDLAARAGEVSAALGLPASLGRRTSGLSGGQAARLALAAVLLARFDVLRPAGALSPGERTRADLALLAHAGANLLVLDEPTNHLDLPAIEQLEQALGQYDGTLLLVTHDRRLLERVQVTRRLVLADGQLTEE